MQESWLMSSVCYEAIDGPRDRRTAGNGARNPADTVICHSAVKPKESNR